MKVRDLKLAIICGIETEEIKSLNKYFDDLFNSLTIYTDGKKQDLIFMKDDICCMWQNLKLKLLCCRYAGIWDILETKYHCIGDEIYKIIAYKVEEYYNSVPLKPCISLTNKLLEIEHDYKNDTLKLYNK